MTAARAPRRSAWTALRSVRVRLLLSLGLLLTPAVMGTYASWTDTATISGIKVQTGSLDIAVGANAGDQLTGQGGTWNHTSLALTAMLPGESVAQPLTVRNAGTAPLKFSTTASASSNALSPSLKLTVVPGATVANTGAQANGNRTGSCTGGSAAWLTAGAVGATPTVAFPSTAVTLAPGAATSVCVLVALDSAAGNALQNQDVTVTLVVNASQP